MRKIFLCMFFVVFAYAWANTNQQQTDRANVIVASPSPEIVIRLYPGRLATIVFPESHRFTSVQKDQPDTAAAISVARNVVKAIVTAEVRVSLVSADGKAYSLVLIPDRSATSTIFTITPPSRSSLEPSSREGGQSAVENRVDIVGVSGGSSDVSGIMMYKYTVVNLLYAMYNGLDYAGFTRVSSSGKLAELEGGNGTFFYSVVETYRSSSVDGLVVVVLNKGANPVQLREVQFYNLFTTSKQKVMYVMLDGFQLLPGQFTRAFVIVQKN